jgi:hypothetical protein
MRVAAASITGGGMGFGADFWLDYLGNDQWQLSLCCPSGKVGTTTGNLVRLKRVILRADRLLLVWARADRQRTVRGSPRKTEPATPAARQFRKCSETSLVATRRERKTGN